MIVKYLARSEIFWTVKHFDVVNGPVERNETSTTLCKGFQATCWVDMVTRLSRDLLNGIHLL